VCDEQGRLIGVVTDRDLAVRLCAAGGNPIDTPVEAVMTPDVIRCATSDELRLAEEVMIRERKSRIVVTDEQGRLAGVISLSDLAARAPAEAADVLHQVAARELLGARGRRPVPR
jgi:CBS domain-containing protein